MLMFWLICTSVLIQVNSIKFAIGDDDTTYNTTKNKLTTAKEALETLAPILRQNISEQISATNNEKISAIVDFIKQISVIEDNSIQIVQKYKSSYGNNYTNCLEIENILTNISQGFKNEFIFNISTEADDVITILESYNDILNVSFNQLQVLFLQLELCNTIALKGPCFEDILNKLSIQEGLNADLENFRKTDNEADFKEIIVARTKSGLDNMQNQSQTKVNQFFNCATQNKTMDFKFVPLL